MEIPKKNIGPWARDLVSQCFSSRDERAMRGNMFKNLYLTGDEQGEPQTYPATFEYIDNLSSYLYSPGELRFNIEHYGFAAPELRAMLQAGTSEFHKYIRRGNVDTCIEEGVTWSLVKGKTFTKLLWTDSGFQPTLVQPEMMGVLEENFNSLNEQDSFVHSMYLTPSKFARMVKNHPNAANLIHKATKYISPSKGDEFAEKNNTMMQVILGGLQPYQIAGGGQTAKQKGWAQWLGGPRPNLHADIMNELIRLDELWVWDDDRNEYTTIQFVGEDCIITGLDTHRNIFADPFDPDNKKLKTMPSEDNPLAGKHPFTEICPNKLDGYFWGRSELCNVALLQKRINDRIDGINRLLRMQENPPKFFKGMTGVTQQAYSKLNKPGGYMTDSSQNGQGKVDVLAPDLPAGLFDSLHEFERMFDRIGGFTPVMRGRGESGVRAQGHAESLISTSSPRFKDRALLIERQVEEVGGLALSLLQAHVPDVLTAWVDGKKAGIFGKLPFSELLHPSPVPGMRPIEFTFHNIPDDCKVVVDSHSSSPAFSHESQALLFDLFKTGSIKPEELVRRTNPSGADVLVEDIRNAEAEKAAMIQAHPELLEEGKGKKSKKK